MADAAPTGDRARILTVGNAKGGSGKSTVTMHVAVCLLGQGLRVAVLDLDWRQQTSGRILEQRALLAAQRRITLPMPGFAVVSPAPADEDEETPARAARAATYARFCATLEPLLRDFDVVVLDCPGSDTHLARIAHGCADVLLTPLNDSFVDVDVLARLAPDAPRMLAPGWYAEMVFAQRKRRLLADGQRIDWAVMRNRITSTQARNKRQVQAALQALAPRLGFREVQGLGERVIFRELFLRGLTLCDLKDHDVGVKLTLSHLVALREVKDLVAGLRLGSRASQEGRGGRGGVGRAA